MFDDQRNQKRLNKLGQLECKEPEEENLEKIAYYKRNNKWTKKPKIIQNTFEDYQKDKLRSKSFKRYKIYPKWWWGEDESECTKEIKRNTMNKDRKSWFNKTNSKNQQMKPDKDNESTASKKLNDKIFYSRNSESDYSEVPYYHNFEQVVKAPPLVMNKLYKGRKMPKSSKNKYNYEITYDKNFVDKKTKKVPVKKQGNREERKAPNSKRESRHPNIPISNYYDASGSLNANSMNNSSNFRLSNMNITDDMKSKKINH